MINKSFVRFGTEGATFLTPATIGLLIICILLILFLSRKHVLAPLLLGSLFIPVTQNAVIFGVHLFPYRILLIVAWLRLLSGGHPLRQLRLTQIDKVFVMWSMSAAIVFSLQWLRLDALVNKTGFLIDALGTYFLIRCTHPTEEDIRRTLALFAVAYMVIGAGMLAEHHTRVNSFSALGAFSQFSEVGDHRIRSEGPFLHPLIAGTCGAVFTPAFLGLWWQRRRRWWVVGGIVGGAAMTFTSASSTSFLAYAAGIAALLLWPLRRNLHYLRRATVIILITLQLVMKAPVWALIARIDLTGGSSAYHRFELINQAILHFSEWWLLGEKTTYQWGYNLWDTANTYVETAVTGGLLTFILLIALLTYAFRAIGRSCRRAENKKTEQLLWSLGAALSANAIGFIGITFYDQSTIVWYTLLGLIGAASTLPASSKAKIESDYVMLERSSDWLSGVSQTGINA